MAGKAADRQGGRHAGRQGGRKEADVDIKAAPVRAIARPPLPPSIYLFPQQRPQQEHCQHCQLTSMRARKKALAKQTPAPM